MNSNDISYRYQIEKLLDALGLDAEPVNELHLAYRRALSKAHGGAYSDKQTRRELMRILNSLNKLKDAKSEGEES